MTFKEKKNHLLKLLYKERFQGGYFDVVRLLKDLKVNQSEAYELSVALEKLGYVRMLNTKDGTFLDIVAKGIEFIEEDKVEENENELFTENEKNDILIRLDELFNQLNKIEKGQEITYDDLTQEILELKQLLSLLNKKNWKQILKGKLIDIGLGNLTEEVGEVLIDIFKDQKFLN